MKWTISYNVFNQSRENLEIKFDPQDDIADVFFNNTDAFCFPGLLNDAVLEKLFSTGMIWVEYHGDLGWEDFEAKEIFNEDEVRLTHQDWGRSVINKQLFFEILYEYADKHLNVYRNNLQMQKRYSQWLERELKLHCGEGYKMLNSNWTLGMEEGLAKLKTKLS